MVSSFYIIFASYYRALVQHVLDISYVYKNKPPTCTSSDKNWQIILRWWQHKSVSYLIKIKKCIRIFSDIYYEVPIREIKGFEIIIMEKNYE